MQKLVRSMTVLPLALALVAGPVASASEAGPIGTIPVDTVTPADFRSGYAPCTATMRVATYASGIVEHYVEGYRISMYANGQFPRHNSSYGAATMGFWAAEATGSLHSASGVCIA